MTTGPAETQESNFFSATAIVVSGPWPGSTRVSEGRVSRCSPIAVSCPAKSGNSSSCGTGPLGQQDVAGEHHAEFLAVQAHRAVGMARRVDDLE